VLQRIKGDERLSGKRREDVIDHLNGQIHPLDEVSSCGSSLGTT
jgi:nuclear pore complex protein Nup155